MYILSHSLEELSELTRYKIAAYFDINISYLSKKFKKDTKMSLFKFIEAEKMNRARILLETRDDLTVEDISKMFGLEKTEQFRAKFKRLYYITPGQYKALLKVPQSRELK